MTYSATEVDAPARGQRDSDGDFAGAEDRSAMPWVNTWVPAPRASAYARVIRARWRATSPRRIAAKPRRMLPAMAEDEGGGLMTHSPRRQAPTYDTLRVDGRLDDH